MKKIISILLLATFCIFTQLHAQNRADELMKQAQENLTKKEYIKARYLFLQAYNAFATQDKYAQAVECGVNASALYHRENYYKEAFELLRGAEQVVATGEQKTGKAMPNLRFRINKERLQMYINLKNPARAKEQLTKLEETAKASHNDSLSNDLLYTQANYYYTFGMNTQGDAATNRLIGQYKEQKNYAKVDECYKTLISIARKANNAGLVARTYDKYILWTDSVKALTAQEELNALKKKFKWFCADTWLLIILFLATLLTGTFKLLTPVKIPHLGLWHYWLGIAMSITAIIHLVRGLPSWNRMRKINIK